ncbi:MAG: hypothetical protein ABL857_07485, partial [Rickettsiales bacterium]
KIDYAANYTLLVKAAANGGKNALTTATRNFINNGMSSEEEAIKAQLIVNGTALTDKEITSQARENLINQFADPKNLEEKKNPNDETKKSLGLLSSLFGDKSILSSFAEFFQEKIMNYVGAAWEKWGIGSKTDESFSKILARKEQETKIERFTENHKIDPKRLMAELTNLPEGTDKIAAITPEQRAKAAEEAEKARLEANKPTDEQIKQAKTDKETADAAAKAAEEARKVAEAKKIADASAARIAEAAETARAIERAKFEVAREEEARKAEGKSQASGTTEKPVTGLKSPLNNDTASLDAVKAGKAVNNAGASNLINGEDLYTNLISSAPMTAAKILNSAKSP